MIMDVVATMLFHGTRTSLHAWYTNHRAMPSVWTIWGELTRYERCDVWHLVAPGVWTGRHRTVVCLI